MQQCAFSGIISILNKETKMNKYLTPEEVIVLAKAITAVAVYTAVVCGIILYIS